MRLARGYRTRTVRPTAASSASVTTMFNAIPGGGCWPIVAYPPTTTFAPDLAGALGDAFELRPEGVASLALHR